MKRYSKTPEQQNRYYEVDNIYEYMVSTYIYGNISQFRELYRELNHKSKQQFVEYCFSEVNPEYLLEIIKYTI